MKKTRFVGLAVVLVMAMAVGLGCVSLNKQAPGVGLGMKPPVFLKAGEGYAQQYHEADYCGGIGITYYERHCGQSQQQQIKRVGEPAQEMKQAAHAALTRDCVGTELPQPVGRILLGQPFRAAADLL